MAVLVHKEAAADDDNDDDVEMTNEHHTSASVFRDEGRDTSLFIWHAGSTVSCNFAITCTRLEV
jgi:hypothetical protein